jgi:SAM-dependent methyltransferase
VGTSGEAKTPNGDTVGEWREAVPWWLRWEQQLAQMTRPFTDALARAARLRSDDRVLDLACGLGNPALTLAELVPAGRVTALDATPEMLEEARSRAAKRGTHNVDFVLGGLESLPFDPSSFDCVTCRFGVVYAADRRAALGEVLRVLRPGGRAVFVVWGPLALNEYWLISLAALERHIPDLPSGVAQPVEFDLAAAGELTALLGEAGFDDPDEELLTPVVTWPGPPADLVDMAEDDYAGELASLSGDAHRAFVREVGGKYARRYAPEGVRLRSAVVLAWASRRRE